jgi:effector-binding domain-containing protein
MAVQTRTIETTTYISERQHVGTRELGDFLRASTGRLNGIATRLGGPVGPRTTIFHGPVSDAEDGDVQNAMPVADHVTATDIDEPTVLLIEPAREEAYLRITRTQYEYPAILGIYDEVYGWLTHHGYTPSMPPREILLDDPETAGPDDHVCDVAVPFTR